MVTFTLYCECHYFVKLLTIMNRRHTEGIAPAGSMRSIIVWILPPSVVVIIFNKTGTRE